MRSLILFSLLLNAFPALAGRIDKGLKATEGQFPSVVRLNFIEGDYMVGLCTGTLVAPRVVLTAAHCMPKPGEVVNVSRPGDVSGSPLKGNNVIFSIAASGYAREASLFKKQKGADAEDQLTEQMIGHDLAFMVLASAQNIEASAISKLGCSVLPLGTAVSLVGYGDNMPTEKEENENLDNSLHFGSNVTQRPELPGLYYYISNDNGHVANVGDSGGPLFEKLNSKVVYGVTSSKADDRSENHYAMTGSRSAKNFYRELTINPKVPSVIKSVVAPCLGRP